MSIKKLVLCSAIVMAGCAKQKVAPVISTPPQNDCDIRVSEDLHTVMYLKNPAYFKSARNLYLLCHDVYGLEDQDVKRAVIQNEKNKLLYQVQQKANAKD